jgi:cold-inducible RNA-binding protein
VAPAAAPSSGDLKSDERKQPDSSAVLCLSKKMNNKLYVSNLTFETTETELQDLFAQVGTVSEAALIQDRYTGRSRGFAFVTMSSEAEAKEAISKFNNAALNGRNIGVAVAQPRESRAGGAPGGGPRKQFMRH